MTCRICGNGDGNRTFEAREMMFGTREAFGYLECARCGGTRQVLATITDPAVSHTILTYLDIYPFEPPPKPGRSPPDPEPWLSPP